MSARRFLFYALAVLGFLVCWCFLTALILLAQDKLLGPSFDDVAGLDSKLNMNRGIQIVVGHYNGNLPAEHRANLTKGILLSQL